MKFFRIFLALLVITACNPKTNSEIKKYKGVKGDTVAYLSLSEEKSTFHGSYEVFYNESGKDSGNVKGNRIGDTLRGIYTYKSYGGNAVSRPIIFLKSGQGIILGSGAETRYLNIPHYMPGTITFNKNNLYLRHYHADSISR